MNLTRNSQLIKADKEGAALAAVRAAITAVAAAQTTANLATKGYGQKK